MRVLVTGGAGFIGSHVVEAALADGHEVAVLDNLSTGKGKNVPAPARLCEADVRDRESVLRIFREFRPEVVSHQAAQASVAAGVRDPLLDARVNVLGGVNVLDACREVGVRRIVFASTGGAIYGEVPEGARAALSWPPRPGSPYACGKFAIEELLRRYRDPFGLEGCSLRYSNVYGPRQDPHGEAGVVAIFTDRLLAGQLLQINAMETPGDEGCVRDYVCVRDVARANLVAIAGRFNATVVNVCTGVGTTTAALASILEALVGTRTERVFAPPRAGDLRRSVLDPGDLEERIGPLTGLRQGLEETVGWFRGEARA